MKLVFFLFACFVRSELLSRPKTKKTENSTRSKLLVFQEMEFSSSNIKKLFWILKWNPALSGIDPQEFSVKKISYNFSLKKYLLWKRFLNFLKKISNFNKRKPRKKFLIFQETGTLKKLFIFQEMELFSPPR